MDFIDKINTGYELTEYEWSNVIYSILKLVITMNDYIEYIQSICLPIGA